MNARMQTSPATSTQMLRLAVLDFESRRGASRTFLL